MAPTKRFKKKNDPMKMKRIKNKHNTKLLFYDGPYFASSPSKA